MVSKATPFEAFTAIENLLKEYAPDLCDLWNYRFNASDTGDKILDALIPMHTMALPTSAKIYRRIMGMVACYMVNHFDIVMILARNPN